MTDIKLEPPGASRTFRAVVHVPIELQSSTESTQTTRHETLAFGHILAALVCGQLGDDYDRRVKVGVETQDLGLTVVLTFLLQGRHAPLRTEIETVVNNAYHFNMELLNV